jgi:hypothetical protein
MRGNARRHCIMGTRRELLAFCVFLAAAVAAFFHETLFGAKVLSPADVLMVSASFRADSAGDYEPANRLLMDPVLQFQPWLEFNRRMIRTGRLPLWNGYAGCGAPHLANGQSAVFDPFHLLAYFGPMPAAYAWIASARLWTAGLGMFLLARSWGLGFWGRWFAGLVYPFCGFLIVWLLFPVTAVAIWMPWLFLATDRLFCSPGSKPAAALAIVVALVILAGHIQTSAHVLLAGGLYALAKAWWQRKDSAGVRRSGTCWVLGACAGLALSAAQILPLGFYLARSPVWGHRQRETPAPWVFVRPRVLDAACTAVPYVYGSQRRGQPNLSRALGVHNLNESAGGFAGLATLIWLAPLAVVTRGRAPRVAFLTALVAFGAMGAFRWPPVDNLLRALPVLAVTDNRRLTLWVAFGLTLLGGVGLDQIGQSYRLARSWLVIWVAGAMALGCAAGAIPYIESQLRHRAIGHYSEAASATPSADPATYAARAERQVRRTVRFIPRYHAAVALELAALAGLAAFVRRLGRCPGPIKPAVIGLTLCDLAVLGFGLNPAIDRALHEYVPPVITRLRTALPPGSRCVGLGEELPPNVLMRFGCCDVRNYDSVELASSLQWLAPLYRAGNAPPSSRSEITWDSVAQALPRLLVSGVSAIVSSKPPPVGTFDRLEQAGHVWIAWLTGDPWATAESSRTRVDAFRDHGSARLHVEAPAPDRVLVRETWDPGWKASLDGTDVPIERKWGVFMAIAVPAGRHDLTLKYDPGEVRIGLAVSVFSWVSLILVLTGIRLFWIPGITTTGGLRGAWPPR